MDRQSIIEWFHKAKFGINDIKNNEIQTNCPKCHYVNFYFNIKKLVGICHKANCEYHLNPPILEDLVELAGFGPNEWGGYRVRVDEPIPVRFEIELPGEKVIERNETGYVTRFPQVIDYLHGRKISNYDIIRFGMTFDGTRVYVPVYKEEKLVNYVGRDLTGREQKKYLYATGAKTSEWLFGWDEAKYWNRITLVENTFVSISFRNDLQCTTNFGSHLSDTQITLIAKGKAKTVAILWDENTHRAASKAVKRLAQHGVYGCYALLTGQPDDHDPNLIKEITNECHDSASKGIRYIDPFKIAKVKLEEDVKSRKLERRRRR